MAGLTRNQAIDVIETERTYQDKTFSPYQVLPSGLTREQRDSEVLPHLALIQGYAEDAFKCWVFSRATTNAVEPNREHTAEVGNLAALQQIAKIAAIALRALERVGFADQLLTKGLR